jgi:hypothetical protein
MLSSEAIKLLIAAGIAAALFVTGWTVRGWKAESDEAREQRLVQQVIDKQRAHESRVAQTLEDKLVRLKANERLVEKHRETIVERPVYRNGCIDDDGVRLIEAARAGKAPASGASAAVP